MGEVVLAPAHDVTQATEQHESSVLLTVFAVTATGAVTTAYLVPLIPEILRDLSSGTSTAGWIIAAAALPSLVVAPVLGVLADRRGRRRVLLVSLCAYIVVSIGVALATSTEVLLGFRVLQGAASTSLIMLSVVIVGDTWKGPRRLSMLGRNSAFQTLVLTGAPLVGGVLAAAAGWRVALFLVPTLAVVALWRVRGLDEGRFHELRARHAADDRSLTPRRDMRNLVEVLRAVGLPLAGGVVLFSLLFGPIYTLLPLMLEDRYGLGSAARGALLAVVGLGAALGAVGIGRVRRHLSPAGIIGVCTVAYLVGLGLIAAGGDLVVVGLGIGCMGVAHGLALPALQSIIMASTPDGARAVGISLWSVSVRSGQTIGPLAAAAAAGHVGVRGSIGLAGVVVPILALSVRGRIAEARP